MIITEIEDKITDIIHHDNHDEFIYDFLNCQIKLEKNYLLIRNILYEYF